MALKPHQFFKRLQQGLPKLEREIARDIVKVEAQNFHRENFREEGFKNQIRRKWKKRAYTEDGEERALLVKSSNLKRHALNGKVRGSFVEFVFPQNYMKIHNEGGKIKITSDMRKFFWRRFYETEHEFWKNMAITKKKYIKIRKRKYVGESAHLAKRINAKVQTFLNRKLKGL